LTDIPSQYLCQLSCFLLPDECSYFLYDFDVKECQLIDDGEWDCDITVGPATPTFEECIDPTTTTTTTTMTTTTSTTTTTETTTTTLIQGVFPQTSGLPQRPFNFQN
jgi:hypothetical protein